MGAFVPFFDKPASNESLPQYQFTQFKVSKITLPPTQTVRHVERDELKTKVLSDLKNALHLSLGPDQLQQIVHDLSKYRPSPKTIVEHMNGTQEADPSADPEDNPERPNIKLQKEGDKVTNIVVECECGQVIAMDCVY